MRPCQKCLENDWTFKKEDDNSITATCVMCGGTVNFCAKKKYIGLGDKCRKCKTLLIIKEPKQKPKRFKQPFYYSAYYYCPKCMTIYLSPKFKVDNKNFKLPDNLI